MDAEIKIHPKKVKFKIEEKIYGHFIEHLGRCVENGIWQYKKSKIPYININFGSGTSEEAANWVKYTNKHLKNKRVKYWGIANEIFGYWETGYCKNGREYAEKYLKFYKAMKSVDESIKTVAVGTDVNSFPRWNKELLEIVGNSVDYLSIHAYAPAKTP